MLGTKLLILRLGGSLMSHLEGAGPALHQYLVLKHGDFDLHTQHL